MPSFLRFVARLLALFAFVGLAYANEKGSADEAVAMVKKAVTHIKSKGKDAALADFTAGAPGFKEKDLYVWVWDMNGKALAHGANAKLVGKDLGEMKDGDGKELGKALVDAAKKGGKNWVDYKWANPSTKVLEPKSSYIEVVDGMMVGVGIYK